MSIKLKFIKTTSLVGGLSSRYLGEPTLPIDWVKNSIFDEYDVFICQVNSDDLLDFNLPVRINGILYFFINMTTKEPKVLYTTKDKKFVTVEFNDPKIVGTDETYRIAFEENKEIYYDGTKLFGKPLENETFNQKDEILLLQLDTLQDDNVYLSDEDALYQFIINKVDLSNKNFSNVRLDIIHI